MNAVTPFAAALPSGFYWCLAGTVVGGGLVLFIISRMFAGKRVAHQVRKLASDEDGSTIVEFPFALITLTIISVFTWQFGFMLSAYIVVDYAAYAAVRSAIVVIPQDLGSEPANEVSDVLLTGAGKGQTIEEAAEFVCYSISGEYSGVGSFAAYVPFIETIVKIPGADTFRDFANQARFAARFVYTINNTSVRLITSQTGKGTFAGGTPLTVRVDHDFNLRVPIAGPALGRLKTPEGYVTTITGYATLPSEGFTGVVPDGTSP